MKNGPCEYFLLPNILRSIKITSGILLRSYRSIFLKESNFSIVIEIQGIFQGILTIIVTKEISYHDILRVNKSIFAKNSIRSIGFENRARIMNLTFKNCYRELLRCDKSILMEKK